MRSTRLTKPWIASLAARLPDGALPLSVLLTVRSRAGSFVDAGAVLAALRLGFAVLGPVQARLLDRLGNRRIVPAVAAIHGASLAAVAVHIGWPLPLAFLAGAATPPMSALMRATWLRNLADAEDQAFVLGVEALVVEVLFLVGPAVVSLLLVTLAPAATMLVLAGVAAAGSVVFALTAHPPATEVPARRSGLLRTRGLRALMGATVAFGVADGIVQVAVPAVTPARLAGVVLSALGIGTVAGGLAYVRINGRDPAPDFALAHVAMAGALAITSLLTASTSALAAALLLVGLAASPIAITNTRLLARVTAHRHATESYAWLVVAVAVGGAMGTGAGGWLIEHLNARAAFIAASIAVATGGAAVIVWRSSLGNSSP